MRNSILITIFLSILISLFVFAAGSYFLGEFQNKQIGNVTLEDEHSIVAGVVRNEGKGWELIQDDTHQTIGILDVSQDETKVIIKYADYSKVNTLTSTVDETMASEGYTIGASVGVSETWISIYDAEGNLVNPSGYINQSGNIWVQGIFQK